MITIKNLNWHSKSIQFVSRNSKMSVEGWIMNVQHLTGGIWFLQAHDVAISWKKSNWYSRWSLTFLGDFGLDEQVERPVLSCFRLTASTYSDHHTQTQALSCIIYIITSLIFYFSCNWLFGYIALIGMDCESFRMGNNIHFGLNYELIFMM